MPSSRKPPRPIRRERPVLRKGTLRVKRDAASRLRAGHPWIFRDALTSRGDLPEEAGQVVTVQDPEGQFLGQGLWEPEGAVAIRLVSRNPDVPAAPELYRERARQAVARREAILEPGLDAYRLVNGEGDGLPGITVDRFGTHLVAHLYTLAAQPIAEEIYPLLMELTGARGIYEQQRLKPTAGEKRAPAKLMHGKGAPPDLEVHEHGRTLIVDVTAPLGVGLFPDLREARAWVARLAKGRRILNTFSYTGAFTVHAVASGAAAVTAVDLSAKAHAWARKNLRANGLDPETSCRHVSADVIGAVARMVEDGERYDLVVLDPPSFSRGPSGALSTARDYQHLVSQLLPLIPEGGYLLAVSNMARMPEEEFARSVGRGALSAGRELGILRRFPLPPDYPSPPAFSEGQYLKAYLLQA